MGNIIKIIQLALAIIPGIIELVKAIELPGNGADKAAVVLALAKAALELVPDDLAKLIGLDKVEGFIGRVIDIVVGFMNTIGAFKK